MEELLDLSERSLIGELIVLLRRLGYVVIPRSTYVSIEDTLSQIQQTLAAQAQTLANLPAQIAAQLPASDNAPVLSAIQTLSDTLASDNTALESAIAAVQATLGPPPTT